MNTTTRATYANANLAHASTAHTPLIRPEGIVMPQRRDTCRLIAEAYQRAIHDPSLRLPVDADLVDTTHRWLSLEVRRLGLHKIGMQVVDTESSLTDALSVLASQVPGQWVYVPVSSVGNESRHPVWTAYQNLQFRLVHDVAHYEAGSDDTFEGELDTLRYTLTETQECQSYAFPHFLASEVIGQVAFRITYGYFPQQIIAQNILPLI